MGAPDMDAPTNEIKALIWNFKHLPGVNGVGG
jgi:hypothetical protein